MKPKLIIDSQRKEIDLLGSRAFSQIAKNNVLSLVHTKVEQKKESDATKFKPGTVSLFGSGHPESLLYSHKIQKSILPKQEILNDFFADSMIIFKPKSLVSGDFYWFSRIKNKLLFAIGDCSCQGMDGAYMSIVMHSMMNEVVHSSGIVSPSEILTNLNRNLRKFMQKEKTHKFGTEGIEMSLCLFDPLSRILEFSGANRPMLILHDRNFKQMLGTTQSLSGALLAADPVFQNETVKLFKGDKLFLLTDGYLSQQGGDNNSCMMDAQFHKVLRMIQPLKMAQEKKILEGFFEDWRAENDQSDDVLMLGITV